MIHFRCSNSTPITVCVPVFIYSCLVFSADVLQTSEEDQPVLYCTINLFMKVASAADCTNVIVIFCPKYEKVKRTVIFDKALAINCQSFLIDYPDH